MGAATQDQYLASFLVAADLPGMRRVQDSRRNDVEEREASFTERHGLFAGLSVWMGADDAAVWRLVDIRYAFADEESATAFHRERLRELAERTPSVPGASQVGAGCTVFGGSRPNPFTGLLMTTYFYVFRVNSLVAKLFVAQSEDLPPNTLSAAEVAVIARRVEARMVTCQIAKFE